MEIIKQMEWSSWEMWGSRMFSMVRVSMNLLLIRLVQVWRHRLKQSFVRRFGFPVFMPLAKECSMKGRIQRHVAR